MPNKLKQKKILYLSFDGILEPLGDSQILQYIVINSKNFIFKIISFEKKIDIKNQNKLLNLKNIILENSIEWKYFSYNNYFKYFSFSIRLIKLFFEVLKSLIIDKYNIVHVRSYLPGIVLIPLKLLFNFKIIFDMRGFLPYEKIERNKLNSKIVIFLLFYLEKKLIRTSDKVITLTHHSKKILQQKYFLAQNKIIVIRTCADTDLFYKPNFQRKKNNTINFCYMGSLNYAYDFDKIILFIKKFLSRNENIKMYFFMKEKDFLLKKLKFHNVPLNKFSINFYSKIDLIDHLSKIDYAIFFLKKNKSVSASFPTKIAEFLSLGIPIITNDFNQDIVEIIKTQKIGFIIKDNTLEDYDKLNNFNIKERNKLINKCRNFAINNLSLVSGSKEYNKIYKSF